MHKIWRRYLEIHLVSSYTCLGNSELSLGLDRESRIILKGIRWRLVDVTCLGSNIFLIREITNIRNWVIALKTASHQTFSSNEKYHLWVDLLFKRIEAKGWVPCLSWCRTGSMELIKEWDPASCEIWNLKPEETMEI